MEDVASTTRSCHRWTMSFPRKGPIDHAARLRDGRASLAEGDYKAHDYKAQVSRIPLFVQGTAGTVALD